MLFIMHIRFNIIDIIIKNLALLFLLNTRDNKLTNMRKSKSINNGDMLNALSTVIIRKNKPFIKFDKIKNTSNKKSSFITFTRVLNCFFCFINITKLSIT